MLAWPSVCLPGRWFDCNGNAIHTELAQQPGHVLHDLGHYRLLKLPIWITHPVGAHRWWGSTHQPIDPGNGTCTGGIGLSFVMGIVILQLAHVLNMFSCLAVTPSLLIGTPHG